MQINDIKEMQELADKLGLPWISIWDEERKIVEIFENNFILGMIFLGSSQKLKAKPKWVKAIGNYCTALRDEKQSTQPRHTDQTSRNKKLVDTNSATAYKQNTKSMGVLIGAKKKKNQGTQNTTQAGQNV